MVETVKSKMDQPRPVTGWRLFRVAILLIIACGGAITATIGTFINVQQDGEIQGTLEAQAETDKCLAAFNQELSEGQPLVRAASGLRDLARQTYDDRTEDYNDAWAAIITYSLQNQDVEEPSETQEAESLRLVQELNKASAQLKDAKNDLDDATREFERVKVENPYPDISDYCRLTTAEKK